MPPAPPTGPARTTRSSTRGGGPRRRGGGVGRTDRDGDLDMGAGLTSSNGITKRSSTNTRSSTRGRGGAAGARGGANLKAVIAAQDKVLRHLGATGSELTTRSSSLAKRNLGMKTLKVEGLQHSKAATNPDRGLRAALDFLERKAGHLSSKRVAIKKSQMSSDSSTLYILLGKDDAEEVVKINGFAFAGATLSITESVEGFPGHTSSNDPGQDSHTKQTREKLEGFLGQRYDPNLKLLNLSNLGQDPLLVEMQLFQEKERAEKTFKVFMTICEHIFKTREARREAVTSVSLANNSIDNVGQVYDLAVTFPDLKHLDLSGNQIANVKSLNRWSHHRLQSLETLLLSGNPIESAEPSYKDEMLRWFPKLQNLSNNQVRTPDQVAAAEAAKAAARPVPIPQHGSDFRDAGRIGEEFVTRFLPLFDSDRPSLASMFYDDHSHFSLSVVNASINRDDPHTLSWAPYLKFSRNLTRVTHQSTRVQRLMKGRQNIQELWKMLPATKHPDLASEFSKYIIDCHPLAALADPSGQSNLGVDGLIITIHGEFDESEAASGKIGKRSFSRVIVLGPAVPGSPNPVRVVSDMLSLRAYTPAPGREQGPAASAAPLASQLPQQTQQQQQQQLIAELSRRTNMTPQFSEMCLAEANWNLDAAMVKFEQTKPMLGADAFLSAPTTSALAFGG